MPIIWKYERRSRENSGSKLFPMQHIALIHSSSLGLFNKSFAGQFLQLIAFIFHCLNSICSGFLVSYIYFRTNAKGKLEKLSQGVSEVTAGTFHFFGLIGYRFVRLTAPYMFVLGLVEVVMKYFHHHSVFETPAIDHENCPNYWWRNILYVNTLFPVEQMVNSYILFNLYTVKFK